MLKREGLPKFYVDINRTFGASENSLLFDSAIFGSLPSLHKLAVVQLESASDAVILTTRGKAL